MDVKKLLSKNATAVILIAMCILITIFRPKFISPSNLISVLSAACVYGCMALGATFILISGGIDLAAGSEVAFAGVAGALFGQVVFDGKILSSLPEMPFIVPVLVTLLAGTLVGLVNGLLIAYFNTPPFILTLGMTTVVRGFTLLLTGGEPVSNLSSGYSVLGGKILSFIPISVIIFIVLIIVAHILLKRTQFGYDTYAIGSNKEAARVSGVKVPKTLVKIYAFAGLMYAFAGLIMTSRAVSIHPGAAVGYELTAIAGCVIGGVSPSGGVGTIANTVIGTLIISVLRNGLTLLGVDSYWQQIAEGLVIVIAVAIDVRRSKNGK